MNRMYFDFARGVQKKLQDDVNGRITFAVYENIDTIIFFLNFKDFRFNFGINEITDAIYSGTRTAEDVAKEIEGKYRGAILNAFFKSNAQKERDNAKKLGIYLDDVEV